MDFWKVCTKKRWGFAELALLTICSLITGYCVPNEMRALSVSTTALESSHLRSQAADGCNTHSIPPQQLHLHDDADDTTTVRIAWLMSFPNSGTSYTGRLVRVMTKTTTGTNYGIENIAPQNASVPIYADQQTGPFLVDPEAHPEYTNPRHYILTKTHCGLRCERCPPGKYDETTYSFRNRCLSGKWRIRNENGTMAIVKGSYAPDRVAKAVHLIRNPFDNVVSRFHLERRTGSGGQLGRDYPESVEGFRAFCAMLDERFGEDESRATWMTTELEELTKDIPCRADFFRFTEWHNMAFVTTRDLELETYVLHYDWYETRFEETVTELLDFLKLERRGEVFPFQDGKTYSEYFTPDERSRMQTAMKQMASPVLWREIVGYF